MSVNLFIFVSTLISSSYLKDKFVDNNNNLFIKVATKTKKDKGKDIDIDIDMVKANNECDYNNKPSDRRSNNSITDKDINYIQLNDSTNNDSDDNFKPSNSVLSITKNGSDDFNVTFLMLRNKDKNWRSNKDLRRDIVISTQLREYAEQRIDLETLITKLSDLIHEF